MQLHGQPQMRTLRLNQARSFSVFIFGPKCPQVLFRVFVSDRRYLISFDADIALSLRHQPWVTFFSGFPW